MDSGYRHLAPFYDALFPVSAPCQTFLTPLVQRLGQKKGGRWLDVGCGTGALAAWLSSQDLEVWGLEPDQDFAREAENKLAGARGRILVGDTNTMDRLIPQDPWEVITCLGNVLAHLTSDDQIDAFFRTCASLLASRSGILVIQIVNFDRYRIQGKMDFPILERVTRDGTPFTFHRHYTSLSDHADTVLFETELDWGEGKAHNAVPLRILEKDHLVEQAGRYFPVIGAFGDFSGIPWRPDSPGTILACLFRKEVWFQEPDIP